MNKRYASVRKRGSVKPTSTHPQDEAYIARIVAEAEKELRR